VSSKALHNKDNGLLTASGKTRGRKGKNGRKNSERKHNATHDSVQG
jgi:hypothetical protein